MSKIPLIPSLDYERDLLIKGYDFVIGIDEVGRGSLAGPVMVGAAILGASEINLENVMPEGLADSKLLTERKREALYEPLKNWCSAYSVGSCTNHEIDDWGIEYSLGIAALKAISSAQENLIKNINNANNINSITNTNSTNNANSINNANNANKNLNEFESNLLNKIVKHNKMAVILDGPYDYIHKVFNTFDAPILPVSIDVNTLVKADRKCASVAAASVIAKVTRDHMMIDYAGLEKYAVYDWAHNKGYGSAAHREAISKYGASDLHRISWHLS